MICPPELCRLEIDYKKEFQKMTEKRDFWRSVTIGMVCGDFLYHIVKAIWF